jgi:RNA polymerase sigma factor (sigma-70 family)
MGNRPPQSGEFDPAIAELIRHKVRKLIGNYGYTGSDEEDLRQELTFHVIRNMKSFDASRSSPRTFADRIVTSKIASILEHRTAAKRDKRREQPLTDEQRRVIAGSERSTDQKDLAIDVRAAMESLPADLCAIATLFMSHNEAEVVRRSGLSRQQVRTARERIAQHLRDMGLGEKT